MATTKTYALILVSVIVSFLGFCIENIFISYSHGFMDNRNMILPFLFGYGLFILAFYALFGTPNEPLFFGNKLQLDSTKSTIYYFFAAFLAVCVGELILGHLTELLCGIIWWDYSLIPLHITRYTSVPTSTMFAFLITFFMKYLFDPILKYFSGIRPNALAFLAIFFTLILSLDMLNSGIYMFKNNQTLQIWRRDFNKPLNEFFSSVFNKI